MLDDALVPIAPFPHLLLFMRLNPCYAGRCSSTNGNEDKANNIISLNPCYAGRCSSTATTSVNPFDVLAVSILVMLDDALVLFGFILNGMIHLINVSILVMLDDALVLENRDYTDYQYVTELH